MNQNWKLAMNGTEKLYVPIDVNCHRRISKLMHPWDTSIARAFRHILVAQTFDQTQEIFPNKGCQDPFQFNIQLKEATIALYDTSAEHSHLPNNGIYEISDSFPIISMSKSSFFYRKEHEKKVNLVLLGNETLL